MPDFKENYSFDTLAIRAGQVRTAEGEHSEPVFATSSYVFASAAEAAARFSGDQPGNIYSRFTNPTVRTFEQRLAALEGAESCVATASGMSAILSTSVCSMPVTILFHHAVFLVPSPCCSQITWQNWV